MKFILLLLLMSTYSIAQTTKDGSTSSSSNTSATRSSYNVGDYQIDGVSAAEKLNQAKQGQFNNISYTAGGSTTGGGGYSGGYFKDVGYVDPQCCNCSQCYSECPVSSVGLPTINWTEACSGGGGGGR
jgi:hypothetical protein